MLQREQIKLLKRNLLHTSTIIISDVIYFHGEKGFNKNPIIIEMDSIEYPVNRFSSYLEYCIMELDDSIHTSAFKKEIYHKELNRFINSFTILGINSELLGNIKSSQMNPFLTQDKMLRIRLVNDILETVLILGNNQLLEVAKNTWQRKDST